MHRTPFCVSYTMKNTRSAMPDYVTTAAILFALFIYSGGMEWSSEKVDKLIALYETHPHLYNSQLSDYHNA